ncbi:MAG TPA: BRCT domain-containing protein [Candidatus Glassbacteria bacterium]|nr:BRCT domain-containing protein [Candidatus Glassbacteria bacterium]
MENGCQIKPPEDCPSCSTKLIREGEYIFCPNEDCPGRRLGDFLKWIEVTEIEEAGPAFLQDIMSTNLFEFEVKDISDLYRLTVDDLTLMDGYKKTKATKIIRNIKKKKKLPLETILAGLNIPNVGRTVCKKIVNAGFDNLDDIYEMSVEDLENLEGIGNVKANLFYKGIRNKRKILAKLLRNGVEIMKKQDGELTGKSFCFTGALNIKRSHAKKVVESLGGEFKSSVSKGLTYLVQADPASQTTKSKKALTLGTKVIGEEEFLNVVGFTVDSIIDDS